jgi:four helix bundle protein
MGTGFHDLEVWREAKALAVEVYRATDTLKDFSLRDQLRRAAVSVPSNIAEGDERDTDKEAVRFFFIAKGSLAELRTQLEIATDVGLLGTGTTAPLLTRATSLAKRLGALIKARTPHV